MTLNAKPLKKLKQEESMNDQEKKNPEIANHNTSFSSSKKAPFEKRTSSNDKTDVSFTEKQAQKIFGTPDKN